MIAPAVGALFILLGHANKNTKAILNCIGHRFQTRATYVLHVNPHFEIKLFQFAFDFKT